MNGLPALSGGSGVPATGVGRERRRTGNRVVGLRRAVVAATALVVLLTGCGTGSGSVAAPALKIFAAASLQGPFDVLVAEFAAAHPEVPVAPVTYGGSSDLVTQLLAGAESDVFAAADAATMDKLSQAGKAATVHSFATNTLRIAVQPGNPHGITGLADLIDPGLQVVVCDRQVPCGAAAFRALDAAGVVLTPVSQESNVKAVLTKVQLGEADAGLVYATDILAAGSAVSAVTFPEAAAVANTYQIAIPVSSTNPAAQAFIDLVLSARGQSVLAAAGFGGSP